MTERRLKTLTKITNILNMDSATGEDVGRLFLLCSAEEMKNSRQGANIAPVSYEDLQNKANALETSADRDTLQDYINIMNTVKNSYNLCAGYKLSVLYRLTGLARITDRILHAEECMKLTNGQGQYTKDFVTNEAKTLGSPAIQALIDLTYTEARFSYAHNVFINILADFLDMEELEAYKIHTEEIEAEITQCMEDISSVAGLIPKGYEAPQLDIKALAPTETNTKEAEEFIKDIKHYNSISPTIEPIYILLGKQDHIKGDMKNA